MRFWHWLHLLFQCFNVLCLVDHACSISEETHWNDSSKSSSVTGSTNLSNVSTTTRQDETTLSSEKSFVTTEEMTILRTSPRNNLDDDSSSVESTPAETNDISEDSLNSKMNYSKQHYQDVGAIESAFQHLVKLDSDNTIETSDNLDIHSSSLPATDSDEIPECQSLEQSSSLYDSIYIRGNKISMKENVESSGHTTERTEVEAVEVEDLTIKDTTPTTLTVSWKRPNNSAEVFYYVVEWYHENAAVNPRCKVSNETEVYEIVLTSLKACRTYTVKVKPHTNEFTGVERVVTGTTGLDVNNDPLSLKVTNTTTDSLKISWNMPGTDCVAFYLVKVCEKLICTEAQINTTTYTKTDLSPCVTYFFNLTVHGIEGPYGTVNATGETDFLKPGSPMSARTVSETHSVDVFWREPVGFTCAKSYRVTWSHDGKTKTDETTVNSIKLQDLEACTAYKIVIKAIWDDGESDPCTITSQMTLPDVNDPPVASHILSVTKDEIGIQWVININKTNNCADIVFIAKCTAIEVHGMGYIPKNATTEILMKASSLETIKMLDVKVQNLSAFTNYSCHSITVNSRTLNRQTSLPVYVETSEDVPSAPELVPALQSIVTNTSITLMWKKPNYVPGILRKFTIQIIWQYEYDRPSWCPGSDVGTENITIADVDITSFVYKAMPKTRYRIKMDAYTNAGSGNASKIEEFYTNPGIPSEVTQLRYMMNESSSDPNILKVTIMWGLPCRVNSDKIEYFHVTGNGEREDYEEHSFNHNVNYTNHSCINETCSIMIDDLREEHTYEIEISVKVADYKEFGASSTLTLFFPPGIPPPPDVNYTSLISIDPLKARRTTTTATVLLPIFPDTRGVIRCYAIIVAKLGYNMGSSGRCENILSCPYTATWKESKLVNFEMPYQAVNFCADSYASYVADYGRLRAVKFVLGEDTETCPILSSSSDERSYCNGPLNPDTWYHIRMRAFTNGGYRDSITFTAKTNAELQVGLVIGTVFGILFLGILTTMMLLVRKCSLQAVLRRFLHSDMSGSPVPAPFTRRKFIAHCQQLADNPGKLSNEYQLLQTLSVDLQMPTNAACLQANRKKNRYTDILPYDFSRVKLEVIDNDPNTDYINASFIKGTSGEEEYIACQGPKEETTYDFWRMIDQYDVKIIVMLTQLVEKNKEKCHQYFPTIKETFTYENMSIRCTSELDYRTYTHRTLVLQKEYEKRIIVHLHFKDWPDHDVPEDFDPMINFCQLMRRHMEAHRGLVVVHCSAGIGRTGTLIAIDILLQHIKDNRKLDVFGTVYRLRHHRINMVQRESQYAYIYNCIRQVLKNPYFSKTYKPPSVNPIFENNSQKKKETSDSSTDLVSSLETLKKSSFSTSVESAEPIYQTSSELTSRTCYPFNGLRCAKSTSAINARPFEKLMGRYNTHDHLIPHISDVPEMKNSNISFDITDSEGSTTSLYENMQPLLRSKSAQVFGREDNSYVTQKLLEHDTSL